MIDKAPRPRDGRTVPPVHRHREPLERLRHGIDRLIDDFSHVFAGSPLGRIRFEAEPFWRHTMSWGDVPPIDIVEQDDQYVITAELPATDESDIELIVSGDNRLTLRGGKAKASEDAKHDYYLCERHHGPFQRTFRIPGDVDIGKVHASLKSGLLTIILPKTPESVAKHKKIAITKDDVD